MSATTGLKKATGKKRKEIGLMETWQKDKPDVKEEIFLALLFKQVVAETIKSDLRGSKSCMLLEMGIRVRAVNNHNSRLSLWHIMERSKGTFYTSGVSTSMQINYTGWKSKSVQTGVELMKSRKKRPKTKSEHSNKNKEPAEAADKGSHQRQMLENLGLRCSRLLWLRRGWMMHLLICGIHPCVDTSNVSADAVN